MEAQHDGELVRKYHLGPDHKISRVNDTVYKVRKTRGNYESRYLYCPGNYVSKNHCEISRKNNAYWIKDLGSTNGTFLNGVQLQEYVERELRFGDTIGLGVSHLSTDPKQKKDDAHYFIFDFVKARVSPELVDLTDETPALADEVHPGPRSPSLLVSDSTFKTLVQQHIDVNSLSHSLPEPAPHRRVSVDSVDDQRRANHSPSILDDGNFVDTIDPLEEDENDYGESDPGPRVAIICKEDEDSPNVATLEPEIHITNDRKNPERYPPTTRQANRVPPAAPNLLSPPVSPTYSSGSRESVTNGKNSSRPPTRYTKESAQGPSQRERPPSPLKRKLSSPSAPVAENPHMTDAWWSDSEEPLQKKGRPISGECSSATNNNKNYHDQRKSSPVDPHPHPMFTRREISTSPTRDKEQSVDSGVSCNGDSPRQTRTIVRKGVDEDEIIIDYREDERREELNTRRTSNERPRNVAAESKSQHYNHHNASKSIPIPDNRSAYNSFRNSSSVSSRHSEPGRETVTTQLPISTSMEKPRRISSSMVTAAAPASSPRTTRASSPLPPARPNNARQREILQSTPSATGIPRPTIPKTTYPAPGTSTASSFVPKSSNPNNNAKTVMLLHFPPPPRDAVQRAQKYAAAAVLPLPKSGVNKTVQTRTNTLPSSTSTGPSRMSGTLTKDERKELRKTKLKEVAVAERNKSTSATDKNPSTDSQKRRSAKVKYTPRNRNQMLFSDFAGADIMDTESVIGD